MVNAALSVVDTAPSSRAMFSEVGTSGSPFLRLLLKPRGFVGEGGGGANMRVAPQP